MQLHQRLTNRNEKERMLHYFICSSLFDNFCDRKELKREELYAISFSPENYAPKTFDEKLFLHSHLLLKDYVREKNYYEEVAHKLFNAQQASLQQFDPNITYDELEAITFMKGGYSVLLCHFYLDENVSQEEKQCWYRIGSIIQLTNDLYDIYKDLQDGSYTLANKMINAYAFNQFFLQQIKKMKQDIAALPYGKNEKQQFTIAMMGVCAFGLIAIEQLMQLQQSKLQLPDFKTLPRKALIVDMEKPANLWRWIRLVYLHSKENVSIKQPQPSIT
jgi:hypothetical protein